MQQDFGAPFVFIAILFIELKKRSLFSKITELQRQHIKSKAYGDNGG